MATTKQIEANIRNSKNSTGPKSPEGKAASAANAVKHGLLAGLALIQGEQKAEFEALAEVYYNYLQPEGPLQRALVGEIIEYELWRRRFALIEAGLLSEGGPSTETLIDVYKALNQAAHRQIDELQMPLAALLVAETTQSKSAAKSGTSENQHDPSVSNDEFDKLEKAILEALRRKKKESTDNKNGDSPEQQAAGDTQRKRTPKRAEGSPGSTEKVSPDKEFWVSFRYDFAGGFSRHPHQFAILARYATMRHNRYMKALHELERQKQTRAGQAVPAPLVLDVTGGSHD